MMIRQQILDRIAGFLVTHGLGRGHFGVLAVGDRRFVRELERGVPVTLGRIEQAEAFMSRVEANPALLSRLRGSDAESASVEQLRQSQQDGAGAGIALGAGEGLEGAAEGQSAHGRTLAAGARSRHREALP